MNEIKGALDYRPSHAVGWEEPGAEAGASWGWQAHRAPCIQDRDTAAARGGLTAPQKTLARVTTDAQRTPRTGPHPSPRGPPPKTQRRLRDAASGKGRWPLPSPGTDFVGEGRRHRLLAFLLMSGLSPGPPARRQQRAHGDCAFRAPTKQPAPRTRPLPVPTARPPPPPKPSGPEPGAGQLLPQARRGWPAPNPPAFPVETPVEAVASAFPPAPAPAPRRRPGLPLWPHVADVPLGMDKK